MPIQWQVPVALAWIECLTVNKLESNMATIKIKQIKSKIGAPIDQKRTLQSLGLRKISQVVEREDSPEVRGMIRKVHHLVTVVE